MAMKSSIMEFDYNGLVMNTTQISDVVDKNCGLGNLNNFVSAGNKSVGEVTVAWGFGFEVITRLENVLKFEDDMDEENWKDFLKSELSVLRAGFEEVFKLQAKNFKFKGRPFEAAKVITKITEDEEVDKILTHRICATQIINFYEATACIDTESIESLRKAAKLFIEIGRFFQELTIDSAKTADNVFIPNFDAMQKIHLASRQRDKDLFNAQINWDGKKGVEKIRFEVEARKEEAGELYEKKKYFEAWKHRNINYKFKFPNCATVCYEGKDCEIFAKGEVKKYVIADQNQKMRKESLYSAAEFASKAVVHKQVISDEFKNFVAEIAKPLVKKYGLTIKIEVNNYRLITTAKAQQLSKIRTAFQEMNKELLESKLKYAKKMYDPFFECIANNVRAATSNLTAIQRAALAFQIILNQKSENDDPNKISAFAHDCLKEETSLLMLAVRKHLYGKEVPTVQEKLVCSDFEEGTVVTFKDGIYKEGLNRAIALNAINGKFTIRKDENGHFYAEGNLVDMIESRIPKGRPNQLCFVTKANDKCSAAVPSAMKKLSQGKEVILAGYHKTNGVKDLSDAVIVDGEEIINYVTSKGADEYGKAINFKVGKVAYAARAVRNVPEGSGSKPGDYDIIICILEDVKDLKGLATSERLNNIKPLQVDLPADKQEKSAPKPERKTYKPKFIVDAETTKVNPFAEVKCQKINIKNPFEKINCQTIKLNLNFKKAS